MRLRHTPSRDEQQAFLDYGDRVVDGDTLTPTNDLESTFLKVQRAMQSNAAASREMPDHLKARAWEDIVRNSAVAPTGRTIRTHRPRPRPWMPLPSMGRTGVANIALALLVVIAGFGAWRVINDGFGGGNGGENDPTSSQPHYAQAPMTPVPIATAMMDETATGCDFGAAVPLYQRVDMAPANGTILYLTSDGQLMLHCDGQPKDSTLAENVTEVSAVGVPNVVELQTDRGENSGRSYLNFATGEDIEVNTEGVSSYNMNGYQSPRFVIGTAPDDPLNWAVYDLEAMTSASLTEISGASFPSQAHLSVSIPDGSPNMAFAMGTYGSEGSARIAGDKGGGGDILVLYEDLTTTAWLTIPDDFPLVTNISMADDGSHLAIISNPFDDTEQQGASETVIGIIDVESGKEIARSETFIPPWGYPFFTWVEDGAAIAYASEHAIHRLAAEDDATPTTLYESEVTVYLYQTMPSTNSLLVQEGVPGGDELGQLLILDTGTGDAMPLGGGRAWSTGVFHMVPWETSLTPIILTTEGQGGTRTWNIVHPVTGESLMSEERARNTASMTENDGHLYLRQTRIIADDAPISAVVLNDGRIVIFDLGTIEPVIRQLTLPEGFETDGFRLGTVTLAPDGLTLIAETKRDSASQYWTLDLAVENAEWMQLPEGIDVTYLHASE